MRVEVEGRDIKAQMDNPGIIDISKPLGHVTILEAVVYGDEGERLEGAIARLHVVAQRKTNRERP